MFYGLNRSICDVFDGMRKCNETRNFSPMMGLIEEAQIFADRMEASLGDTHDITCAHDKIVKLKKEIKVLEGNKDRLNDIKD